jgi:hypothetical protein
MAGKYLAGMVRYSSSHGPKLWRERAEAIRALADQMEDQGTKEALLHLAADYERRATEAEARRG